MTFEEQINSLKEFLKSSLNADNVDFITNLSTQVDELATSHKQVAEENTALKDKIVNYVKNTTFKEPEETHEEDNLTLDEAIEKGVNDILNKRKE